MAVTYGFFNSVNGDRKYNAEQMSEYFRGIINEGVYQHLDGGLAVSAGTGLAVSVASGRAIIQNRWVQNSAALSLTIAAASETYARKDAVVIRLNWSSRAISIAVKTGTPAASPTAPSMTRNSTTYEMALAYVNVAANATSVTVTDKRSDSTVCGWVTVAQSTSGEVDAQLNALKTGFDGVEYPSPVAMIQGNDAAFANQHTSFNPVLFDKYLYYKKKNTPSTGAEFLPFVEVVTDYTAFNNAEAGDKTSVAFAYRIAKYYRPAKTQNNLDVTLIIMSETERTINAKYSTGSDWNVNTNHLQQSNSINLKVGLNIVPLTLTPVGKYDTSATEYLYFIVEETSNRSVTADMKVYLFGSRSVGDALLNANDRISSVENTTNSKRSSFNPVLFDKYIYYKASYSPSTGAEYSPYVEVVTDYSTFDNASAGDKSVYAFGYRITEQFRIAKTQENVDVTLIIKSTVSRSINITLSTGTDWNASNHHLQSKTASVKVGLNIIPLTLTPAGKYDTTATDYSYLFVEEYSNKQNTADMIVYMFGSRSVGDILLPEEEAIDADIIFWGDSLTAGAGGDGTTYPGVCATELGLTYKNCGVGGETAQTISARIGANSFILPAGDVNGTYDLGDFKDDFGNDILPLRQGGSDSVNPIKVNGVECTLSISQESFADPNATYTISGYTGSTLSFDSFIETAGSHFTSDITVIFVGQNGPSNLEQRIAYIDSMIAKCATNKYVVLSLSTGTSSSRATEEETLLKKYGGHLFLTRKMLVNFGMAIEGLTPTTQDETDIAAGTVPTSLRHDGTHLNAYGYDALGKMLADKIRSLGYVD